MTLSQFYDHVISMTSCGGCTDSDKTEMEQVRRNLLNTDAYFQYLGHDTITVIGHKLEDFLIYCDSIALHGIWKMVQHAMALWKWPCDNS